MEIQMYQWSQKCLSNKKHIFILEKRPGLTYIIPKERDQSLTNTDAQNQHTSNEQFQVSSYH
jgi:hypothetical protein